MGFWDDAKKLGRSFSDVVGDSYFNFRCPHCSRIATISGTLLVPKSRAEEVYREHQTLTCGCGYEFGIDFNRAYARCVCNAVNTLSEGFEGTYRCTCNRTFAIQRADASHVYFACFKGSPSTSHACGKSFYFEKSTLERVIRERGSLVAGFGVEVELPINEALKYQLPNFVDRIETAVYPQVVVHDLERQAERRIRSQLQTIVPQNVSGRKITYRRVVVNQDGVLAEELVIE